jgi:hypothetical protein
MEEAWILAVRLAQGGRQSIDASEMLPSGLKARTTAAPNNRRAFPDSRYLANG